MAPRPPIVRHSLSQLAISTKIFGTPGDDVLVGTSDDDLIEGLDGADRLEGGDGNDQLIGGTGQNRYVGGAGDDYIEGGTRAIVTEDYDRAIYSDATGPINVVVDQTTTVTGDAFVGWERARLSTAIGSGDWGTYVK